MKIEKTPLEGLLVITPQIFTDERGWFLESYNQARFENAGMPCRFVQDNHSRSGRGTLRGLHYQSQPGQVKLVRCTHGEVWDVAVDIRPGSPTFGQWWGSELNPQAGKQLYIPIGFAHGFLVLSEWAEVQYKCSWFYEAKTECGIRWNDPDLAVAWPLQGVSPLLSRRDQETPLFRQAFPQTA